MIVLQSHIGWKMAQKVSFSWKFTTKIKVDHNKGKLDQNEGKMDQNKGKMDQNEGEMGKMDQNSTKCEFVLNSWMAK